MAYAGGKGKGRKRREKEKKKEKGGKKEKRKRKGEIGREKENYKAENRLNISKFYKFVHFAVIFFQKFSQQEIRKILLKSIQNIL